MKATNAHTENTMSDEPISQDRIETWLRTKVLPIAERVARGEEKLYTSEEVREMLLGERIKRRNRNARIDN